MSDDSGENRSVRRTPLQQILDEVLEGLHELDIEKILMRIDENVVVIDPHYPVMHMEGKRALQNGLQWAFGGMKEFGFEVKQVFESEDGRRAAIELECSHVIKVGKRFDFKQVWIVELVGDKVTRLEAYVPYGPDGMHGLILGITRVVRKLTGADKK